MCPFSSDMLKNAIDWDSLQLFKPANAATIILPSLLFVSQLRRLHKQEAEGTPLLTCESDV